MRCKKARELYFSNRDGMLEERDKLKLQKHLDNCEECSRFVAEMNSCLDMLQQIPQSSPSDEFEWNVKRRIMQEKVKAGRSGYREIYNQPGWGKRFMAGVAAAVIVVLAGVWLLQIDAPGIPAGELPEMNEGIAQKEEREAPDYQTRNKGGAVYTGRGYPVGVRMVSDELSPGEMNIPFNIDDPFISDSERAMDSLRRENAFLKNLIRKLERENLYLRNVIKKNRSE